MNRKMSKRALFLGVFLLCCSLINCKHETAMENDIKELKESKPEDCRPVATYVRWSEVREYLNDYYKLHLPVSVTGVDLVVMRCRHFLAPCNDENTYCGVEKEIERKVRIPLEYKGEKVGAVVVTFLEDEQCKCVNKEWYDMTSYHDVAAAPVVLDALLVSY